MLQNCRFQFHRLIQTNLSCFLSLFKHLKLFGKAFQGLNMCCMEDKCSFSFFSSALLSVLFAASLSKQSPGASPQRLKYNCLVPTDKKIYQPFAYLKLHCKRNRERLVCIETLLLTSRSQREQGARGKGRRDYSSLLCGDSPRILQSFRLTFTTRSGHLPTFGTAQHLADMPSFCQPQSSPSWFTTLIHTGQRV